MSRTHAAGRTAPVVVIGAGGHACVLTEAILLLQFELAGHLSPEPDQSGCLGRYLGTDDLWEEFIAQEARFAIGLGFVDAAGAKRRAGILARLTAMGAELVTVVHPAAIVSPSARLDAGCFIAAGAIVGTHSHIGRGGIVNSGAVVDHDVEIGENCHVATGARLAGEVVLERDVLIGAGATCRQGVQIGEGAVVGIGAVVIRPVAEGQTVFGTPARERQV